MNTKKIKSMPLGSINGSLICNNGITAIPESEKNTATEDSIFTLTIRGENIPVELKFKFKKGLYKKRIIGDTESADLIDQIIRYGGIIYEARVNAMNAEV
jgi:hypothetical protein